MPERPGTPLKRCALKLHSEFLGNYVCTTFVALVVAKNGFDFVGWPMSETEGGLNETAHIDLPLFGVHAPVSFPISWMLLCLHHQWRPAPDR